MNRTTNKELAPATALTLGDRAFNQGLDHGAQVGAYTKVIATASVTHLKRGSSATTNYSHGFARGFLAGWKAV